MTMFKQVLLCHDGSEAGRRALRRGAELAILLNAHVHVLLIAPSGVADPVVAAGAAGHACITEDATGGYGKTLQQSLAWLRERGVVADGYVTSGNTIDQIAAYAKKLAIDLIVLGHYPQPAGGFWWSTSQRVSLAERTRCCIFVAVDTPATAQG